MRKWFEDSDLVNIDKFKPSDIQYITDIHYYTDYNEFYEKVSFLSICFLILGEKRKFNLRMKFNGVSSFSIADFGESYNQLLGFNISDMRAKGFEKQKKVFSGRL